MARRGSAKPRKVEPDAIYKNRVITKLINGVMHDGKKTAAQKQVYRSFEIIKEKTKDDPIKVFIQAMDKIRPEMEVRPRRVGGAAYQIPVAVRGPRKESLSIRWLIEAARTRSSSELKTFGDKLAAEIIDAANGEGGAVKKRENVEKMAEANRAFAHFRW